MTSVADVMNHAKPDSASHKLPVTAKTTHGGRLRQQSNTQRSRDSVQKTLRPHLQRLLYRLGCSETSGNTPVNREQGLPLRAPARPTIGGEITTNSQASRLVAPPLRWTPKTLDSGCAVHDSHPCAGLTAAEEVASRLAMSRQGSARPSGL